MAFDIQNRRCWQVMAVTTGAAVCACCTASLLKLVEQRVLIADEMTNRLYCYTAEFDPLVDGFQSLSILALLVKGCIGQLDTRRSTLSALVHSEGSRGIKAGVNSAQLTHDKAGCRCCRTSNGRSERTVYI